MEEVQAVVLEKYEFEFYIDMDQFHQFVPKKNSKGKYSIQWSEFFFFLTFSNFAVAEIDFADYRKLEGFPITGLLFSQRLLFFDLTETKRFFLIYTSKSWIFFRLS